MIEESLSMVEQLVERVFDGRRNAIPSIRKALEFIKSKGAVTAEQLVEWDDSNGNRLFPWNGFATGELSRCEDAQLFLNVIKGDEESLDLEEYRPGPWISFVVIKGIPSVVLSCFYVMPMCGISDLYDSGERLLAYGLWGVTTIGFIHLLKYIWSSERANQPCLRHPKSW